MVTDEEKGDAGTQAPISEIPRGLSGEGDKILEDATIIHLLLSTDGLIINKSSLPFIVPYPWDGQSTGFKKIIPEG